MIHQKIREWIKRYGQAEITGIILGLLCATVSHILFNNLIVSAFIGAWAENVGFFGTLLYKDVKKQNTRAWKLVRNYVIEFGPAEYLDSFFIRPFYLSLLPLFIPIYPLAIFAGQMLANVTYYLFVILGYEFRRWKWQE